MKKLFLLFEAVALADPLRPACLNGCSESGSDVGSGFGYIVGWGTVETERNAPLAVHLYRRWRAFSQAARSVAVCRV